MPVLGIDGNLAVSLRDVSCQREGSTSPGRLLSHRSIEISCDGRAFLIPYAGPRLDCDAIGAIEAYSGRDYPPRFVLTIRSEGGDRKVRKPRASLLFSECDDLAPARLVLENRCDFLGEGRNRRVVPSPYRVAVGLALSVVGWVRLLWQSPLAFRRVECGESRESGARADSDA